MKNIEFIIWNDKTKQFCKPIIDENGLAYNDYRDFENGVKNPNEPLLYSGLKDADGKKIFEGYIVYLSGDEESDIEYSSVWFENGGFYVDFGCGAEPLTEYFDSIKIVGDKYNNKELLGL